ncbi:MAG: hypothetical protein OEZ16_01815 [Chromatiales bacterium]|nr:hypothetical protein [Chromatiales bacterium]
MEGISDIRICGMDETRPARIRKEPYINLYFKLNHQAPKEWCEHYNDLVLKKTFPARVEPATGLIIDTWVRMPGEVTALFEELKLAVKVCNDDYIARIEAESAAALLLSSTTNDDGEQGVLNRIIDKLNFED